MSNIIEKIPLTDKKITIQKMYEICYDYTQDLSNIIYKSTPLSSLDIEKYYNFCLNIPYIQDSAPIELIGRPTRIVTLKGLDCKKKAVLIGTYCAFHNIPFRFCVVSQRPDKQFHHIYPEVKIKNQWISFDSTYRNYRIGQNKTFTAKEIY
jgi:hypothetical protein